MLWKMTWYVQVIFALGCPARKSVGEKGSAFVGPRPGWYTCVELFQLLIVLSNAISPDTARLVGRYLAEKLGVEATREAIAAVPIDRVLQAQIELSEDAFAHPDPQRWGI